MCRTKMFTHIHFPHYNTFFYYLGEAESIMASEHDRLDLPLGTPTFDSIEKARRAKSNLAYFLEKWCVGCLRQNRNRPVDAFTRVAFV